MATGETKQLYQNEDCLTGKWHAYHHRQWERFFREGRSLKRRCCPETVGLMPKGGRLWQHSA
eukprot:5912744-Pyramimonas_sp.AAC.1